MEVGEGKWESLACFGAAIPADPEVFRVFDKPVKNLNDFYPWHRATSP